uniref:Urokinase plasminogen activator surface receptor-like n=1 Tax=Ascaris lumbricoides TaxID=6252 RepID=A0A0M3I5Z7_ASCLU
MQIILMLASVLSVPFVVSKCYSCAGTCYSEPCNCQLCFQMGSCESDYCFIERKPTDVVGRYRITKGCVKRPSRTHLGCDYDHFHDHIQCICAGEFCNDMIYIRSIHRRNVTCRKCSDREPDCGESCQGQWCHEDSTTGAAGCGYGPPSLPYFYKGPELLYHRTRLCVTISRRLKCNKGGIRKHRIPQNRRTCNFSGVDESLSLQTCVNCELSAHDSAVTASCKQNTCVGHFCTYATQRLLFGGQRGQATTAVLNERQGCINVTDTYQIQLGCSHKWMDNEEEELLCACKGERCNRNLAIASLNSTAHLRSISLLPLLFLTALCHLFLKIFL